MFRVTAWGGVSSSFTINLLLIILTYNVSLKRCDKVKLSILLLLRQSGTIQSLNLQSTSGGGGTVWRRVMASSSRSEYFFGSIVIPPSNPMARVKWGGRCGWACG